MRKHRPEDAIQRAVFAHLRQRGMPGMLAFHCPNGGLRSKAEAAILYGLGVKAGIPDVIAIMDGKVFALELKAPGGKLSHAQEHTLRELALAGATTGVAEGVDDAIAVLEVWGLVRGRASLAKSANIGVKHIGSMAELVRSMEERAEAAKAAGQLEEYRKGLPLQP